MEKIITKRKNGTIRVQYHFDPLKDASMTDKSFKKDCDVNEIVRKYVKTGQVTHTRKSPGVFADLTQVTDLMGAYEVVKTADTMFKELPSEVRKKFHNDPLILEEWLNDSKNYEEAIELGLLIPRQAKSQKSADESTLSSAEKSSRKKVSQKTENTDE